MTHRIRHRRRLAATMTVAALIVTAPVAVAQSAPPLAPTQQQQITAGIDAAVKVIGTMPRMRAMSEKTKRQLVEFVTGNTMFVMAHELGHGLINEMSMPVLGREEDAADSFAVVTAL